MIENRKLEHLKICSEKNVGSHYNYWDDVILKHATIPKVDLEEVDLSVRFLGKELRYPIIIDAMTGGHKVAREVNKNLAEAAEYFDIGMAVGSQRSAIENRELRDTYSVIKEYRIPLRIGNLGAPQFSLGYGENEIKEAIEMIDAHALEIHFNYLQEAVQPEGDRVARGVLEKIRKFSGRYNLIAKETGAGIDLYAGELMKSAGFKAIDVSGVSGTSFAAVEYYRGGKYGKTFWDWGLPSPYCIIKLRSLYLPIIGSGGIRNGLDAARAIVLGADVVGISRILLKDAMKSAKNVKERLRRIIDELRIATFLSGSSNLKDLKNVSYVITGRLRDWLWK